MLTTESALRKDKTTEASLEHRHFATIAAIIASMEKIPNQEHGFIDAREDVAEHFADKLAVTNPNFDRARFLRACE